jgi:hypothetical protein
MRSHLLIVALCVLPTLGCGGSGGSTPTSPTTTGGSTVSPPAVGVNWLSDGSGGWTFTGTPPACPTPLIFTTPVDLSRVTSILYPGQIRGNYYKAHGGFRLDKPGETGVINIVAPLDGTITRVAQYLSSGELQFMFNFVNDCGIMYRFDHLQGLSPLLQLVAKTLPPATEGDTFTTDAPPGLTVMAGETVGTSVGFPAASNFFFDWGVYDLRQRNTPGQDAAWRAAHPGDQAAWAICWLDHLSPSDAVRVRNLPAADSVRGSMSDYCH